VRAVLDGRAGSAMALVRPPGHHARRAQPFGFCLLNNIACAASYALEEKDLDRLMILDFDAHHGNGTQEAFLEDPRVLYVSLHQRPLFPGTGSQDERGRGPGEGLTVNIPLPPGSGDESYRLSMEQLVLPLACRHQPQVILVSAGYDAHWREPLANLRATIRGFDRIAQDTKTLADEICRGRLIFVLEGGYDHEVLATSIKNLAHILLGSPEDCEDPIGPSPLPPTDDLDFIRGLRVTFDLG